MRLFSKEVKDMNELNEVLKNNSEISKEYEVAVIVYAFDKENKIVFQRRGLGCRDEQLKLETIGGRVKKCLGYERYKIGEVDQNELSNGARELYNIVSEKYSYLK